MTPEFSDISVDLEPFSEHYEILKYIEWGSYGLVMLGRHLLTDTKVAIKAIELGDNSESSSPLREAQCMANLRHPNIVQLFHPIINENSLYLVMELAPEGDLADYLLNHGRMPEDGAQGVFRQLVSALHYCHERGVTHRDVKPENVLLYPEMRIKLTDFGCAVHFEDLQHSSIQGTPGYIAPEVLLCDKYDAGPALDIWGLGVVLYRMLTINFPFPQAFWLHYEQEVLSAEDFELPYIIPSYLSSDAVALLKKLLTINPQKRQNLKNIMPDPWLNKGKEELKPYVEPPNEDVDPWVEREMLTLGFCSEDIKNAVANKNYDKVAAAYHILNSKKSTHLYRTIKVKPFHPPELQSRSPTPVQQDQPECSRTSTTEARQGSKNTTKENTRGSRVDIPKTCLESGITNISVPEPQCHPGDSPSRHTNNEGEQPVSQGRRGLIRRSLSFLRKLCSQRPTKGLYKGNMGKPCPGGMRTQGRSSQGPGTKTPETITGSNTTGAEPVACSRNIIPKISRGSKPTSVESIACARTPTPEPMPCSSTTNPEHTPCHKTTTSDSIPQCWTTPEAIRCWRAAIQETFQGSYTTTPEPTPAAKIDICKPGQGSGITSLSPATQFCPGDSPSRQSTNTNSISTENISQSPKNVARRTLNFCMKICCLPRKNEHAKCKKVKPI